MIRIERVYGRWVIAKGRKKRVFLVGIFTNGHCGWTQSMHFAYDFQTLFETESFVFDNDLLHQRKKP